MDHYDIIIVGAGPAGLSIARELSDSSFNILILDKKRNAEDVHYNTSGTFIDKKKWKLPDDIFHPITKVYFSSENEKTVKNGLDHIINRKKLLKFLEMESKENNNLKIEYSAIIKDIGVNEGGISHISYSRGDKTMNVSAKIFADCSGVGAVLERKLRILPSKPLIAIGAEYVVPLRAEPQTADLLVGSDLSGGYGWVFPIGDDKAIVGYGTLSRERFPEIEMHLKNMWNIKRISDRCVSKPFERNVAMIRTGEPLERFTDKNLVLIGDSAVQANPLVGEGIRFAMDSSRIASRWMKRSIEKGDLDHLKGYERDWKRKYYRKFRTAFAIQQNLFKYSRDDDKMDSVVRRLDKMSNRDFKKLLSADLSYSFLIRFGMKSVFN